MSTDDVYAFIHDWWLLAHQYTMKILQLEAQIAQLREENRLLKLANHSLARIK